MTKQTPIFALSPDRVDVGEYLSRPNIQTDLAQLQVLIQSDAPEALERAREIARIVYERRPDDRGLKASIQAYKKQLPYFLASGYCPKHHNDHSLEYNGVLQIDIDFKESKGNQKAEELKERVKIMGLPFIMLCAISPSSYGVKMLVATTNEDQTKHSEALRDMTQILSNILGISESNFDSLGASQPCYVPFDKKVYVNHNFTPYQWTPKLTRPSIKNAINTTLDNTDLAQQAVNYLIQNRISVANSYDEYLSITAACVNTFGNTEGSLIAYDLLSCSPQFLDSNFCSNFKNHTHFTRHSGNITTAGTLIYLAKENGWEPIYRLPDAKTAKLILRGAKNEKFSSILSNNGIELAPTTFCNRIWVVPTGTGKTFAVSLFAKNHKTVIVCPTLALVENVCKEYGATKFTGDYRQLTGDETFIATTYASYKSLLNRIDSKAFNVFIDESHNFTSSTNRGFLLSELTDVWNISKEFYASVTLLTGTDLYNFHPDIAAMPKVTVYVPKEKKSLEIINCKKLIPAIIEAVKKSINQGRFPLVLLNDTGTKLNTLQTLLSHLDIAFFNSHEKDNDDFIATITDGFIPTNIKGIVTTTVLKEGNNIYNEYAYDIISVGEHHSSTIEQLANRPRNAMDIRVYVLKGENREKSDQIFDAGKEGSHLIWRTQRACDELNTNDLSDTTLLALELQGRNAIQYLPIVENTEGGYSIDYLQINNVIFNRESTAEYKNDSYLISNLEKYGFEYIDTHRFAGEIQKDDQKAIEEANKARKEKEVADYKTELSVINQRPDALEYCEKKSMSRTATKGEKKATGRVTQLHKLGYNTEEAVNMVTEVKNDTHFKLLKNRIVIQDLRNNEEYMSSNRMFSILIQKFDNTFDITKTYGSDEIRSMVVECLSLDKSIFLDPFLTEKEENSEENSKKRIDKCLKVLRLFFDVNNIAQRNGKDVAKVYRICNLNFAKLSDSNSPKLSYTTSAATIDLMDRGYPIEWDMPFVDEKCLVS
jgi:VirE N-terminal domain